MAADRPYGEFYDFYSVSPKYFGYTLVIFMSQQTNVVLTEEYNVVVNSETLIRTM
jgi:hypothetical protein